MNRSNVKDVLIISLKLLVICSVVAVIVSAVNLIAEPRIQYNLKISTANTLTDIYKNDEEFAIYFEDGSVFATNGDEYVVMNGNESVLKCSDIRTEFISNDIKNLYEIKDSTDACLGYCVAAEPMGYKDVVKILISIDSDAVVKSVKIVSLNDTKGFGTRVIEDTKLSPDKNGNINWFLDQFAGLGGDITIEDIDIVSGATKTSKPIVEAVNSSAEQVKTYISANGGAK